jgi:multiple sugar transport system ATP-binding protein
MVFEDVALYPHLTAYENIAYPLRLRRLPPQEIDRKVREVAENLRISHILNRLPQTFSGGELRRVAIGRALVRRPRVFLLDQPLTDLDAKIRQQMTGELKRSQKEAGQTMMYATHDFEEAVTMADRILVIHEGQEEQLGTPEEVYDRPQTPLVGRLVGSPSMNVLSCHSKVIDNHLILEHPAFRLTMPNISGTQLPQEILVGIRPEHVAIGKGEDSIDATVDIVQPLGDQQIVDLRLRDGTVIKIVAPLETELKIEQNIEIQFPLNRIALFDRKQNTRIELERSVHHDSKA